MNLKFWVVEVKSSTTTLKKLNFHFSATQNFKCLYFLSNWFSIIYLNIETSIVEFVLEYFFSHFVINGSSQLRKPKNLKIVHIKKYIFVL